MSWRHPYWDWAAEPPKGESVLPRSMTTPTLTVTMPNGTNTIANPLYAYKFHPVYKEDFYYEPVCRPSVQIYFSNFLIFAFN